MHLTGVASLFLLSASTGCLVINGPGGESGSTTLTAGSYQGPVCDEVRQTEKEVIDNHGGQLASDVPLRSHALVAICPVVNFEYPELGRNVSGHRRHKVLPFDLKAAHFAYEDRHGDDVTAALFVINAAFPEDKRFENRMEQTPKNKEFPADEASEEEMLYGLANTYASLVDSQRLATRLAAMKFDGSMQKAFATRFEAAKKEIDERVAKMPDAKRRIFAETPQTVVRSRQEYFAKNAGLYAKLDELEQKSESARASAETAAPFAASLTAVRSEYLKGCATEECTFDPLYIEATKELAIAFVATKNPMPARAESQLLTRADSNKKGFARQIFVEQSKLAMASREAYETAKGAKAKGMDAQVTKAVLSNVTPMRFVYGTFWEPVSVFPDYSEVLSGTKVRAEVGYIQSIKKQGAKVTVDFKTQFDNVEEPVNCVKTGRLTRIRPDGTLEYEENCQYKTTRVARDKPAPVTLDAAEAGKLETGELLTFLTVEGSRNGLVADAMRDKKHTQIRGDRLTAAAKPSR
jgi:hypothetical protein